MGEARRRSMILKEQRDPGAVVTDAFTHRREIELARALAEFIVREFPGYCWGVEVNIPGGICTLKLPQLMRSAHTYIIHLDSVSDYPAMCRAMRAAGGELLERFRLPREGFNVVDFQDARKLAVTSNAQKMPE